MITFPMLGQFGRLGNQLFQIAATMGVAMDQGETYGFPIWRYAERFPIDKCFYEHLPEGEDYHEQAYEYRPIPRKGSLRLHGYFQSWRYFYLHANVVRSSLTPYSLGVSAMKGAASVHVRRGDYVGNPYHPVLPIDYYFDAFDIIKAEGVSKFIVFSDDPGWCADNLPAPKFEMAPPGDEVFHLSMMASCQHHIIANSSYSWWGAWLNPSENKKIIAPARWFGEERELWNLDDLIPKEWVRV